MARVPWQDLPASVRDWVAGSLGSAVIAAASQPGGFSPGAACRLRLEDGRRAFVKAVSASANPQSPAMHRREGEVAAALPPLGADPGAVTAVVAAVAGYFTWQSLQPDPPGLPTLRAFQAAQGEHALAWLRHRTGWR